jgi:hypothetical protein
MRHVIHNWMKGTSCGLLLKLVSRLRTPEYLDELKSK